MAYPGALDLQALAKLNDIDPAGEGAAAIGSRAIDADGDGRPDLYLVDLDADGSVDGVVKAVDADGDGVNDTFIQYNAEGTVESIGRVDPATGELEVVYEEPDAFDEILGSLGLADLPSPEEALFTSFEDPYIFETYGTYGDDVPEFSPASEAGDEPVAVADAQVTEVDESEAAAMEGGTAAAQDGPAEGEEPPDVVPRIVEIEDRSGGDASSLWAKVDENGDGLADNDVRIDKTSTGTYYGDINKDGYSEDVAKDLDLDGRIDTVDTTGQGSSADTVGADQVVEPGSGDLVDRAPGEDDGAAGLDTAASDTDVGDASDAGAAADDDVGSGSDYDAGSSTSSDSGADSGGSVDTDTGSDSGGSSGGDDSV
jgi:hypothetical protein